DIDNLRVRTYATIRIRHRQLERRRKGCGGDSRIPEQPNDGNEHQHQADAEASKPRYSRLSCHPRLAPSDLNVCKRVTLLLARLVSSSSGPRPSSAPWSALAISAIPVCGGLGAQAICSLKSNLRSWPGA